MIQQARETLKKRFPNSVFSIKTKINIYGEYAKTIIILDGEGFVFLCDPMYAAERVMR